jgi:20S proteasome alpha/beta subunit
MLYIDRSDKRVFKIHDKLYIGLSGLTTDAHMLLVAFSSSSE